MNILEKHKEYLAEQILLHILHNNIVPTAEQLIGILRARTSTLDLGQPQSSQPIVEFAYREESSANKVNKLSRSICDDLNVLYRTLASVEEQNEVLRSIVLPKLDSLSRKCAELLSRADRLLITAEDTTGLLHAVGDEFTDTSKIDLLRSTATIDLEGQTVHSRYLQADTLRIDDSYNLNNLRNGDILISVLTAGASPAPGTRDSENRYLLSGDSRAWIYTVSSERQNPVSIAVQINFSNCINGAEFLKTRKIVFSPFIVNNSVTVLLQYSKDGVLWQDVPSENPQRQIAAPTVFLTEEFEFKYLRVVMTKSHHTRLSGSGKYIHDFGIKEIKISNTLNFYERESVFWSNVLPVDNVTKASLSVACEHVPPETSIDYYIGFVINGESTELQRVDPLNRDDLTSALIAETGGISSSTGDAVINWADRSFDGAQNANLVTLDIFADEAVRLWRNVGVSDALYSTRQADTRITEAGWEYKDGTYTTYIQVTESGGLTIDIGGSPMVIDGVSSTGRIRLSRGVHKVEVLERNWYSLEGLYSVTSFDPITKTFTGSQRKYGDRGFTIQREEEPEIVVRYNVTDPLYPYNHKLLVEGLDYENNFDELSAGRIYRGVGRFAAFLPDQVSLNLLEGNDSLDRGQFSIVTGRSEGEAQLKFALKWTAVNEEEPRELFVIETVTGDRASGVILKAILKTTNPKKSPSLDGYEIRVV